jgi:hypothetical protein
MILTVSPSLAAFFFSLFAVVDQTAVATLATVSFLGGFPHNLVVVTSDLVQGIYEVRRGIVSDDFLRVTNK